ncbi:helix-turn-helix domain-containing protein [Marinobacterium sediminicola]|uniref:Helix-turn-helix domain-containing protein n=1 Tax=Marinobacterium sediminicola TaxID=518898 RepID=A0ABY1S3B9_9GAMM|nr:helix-turn-helix domain-containing protein [Marinobacterium sediminicola]ULG68261.1 AraC family transcriptional regulator [Marinobacterium sediminicola]SMR77769.1 Helix-turn-helix domain-containing protein [Marinobacterium sediminicola]
MNCVLPFSYNICLESEDFDEAQAFLNSRIDEREVTPLTAQGGGTNRITLQPLQQTLLFGAHWGERVHIRSGALSTCHLVFPLYRSIEVRNLNRVLGPNEMLLMMPGSEADLIWDSGTSAIVISFDSATVHTWSSLEGESLVSGVLRILRPDSLQVRSMYSLLQCVASQHQIHEGSILPVMQQHWESLLIESLADQLTDPAPAHIDILPLHLRHTVDWLKAHIAQPVSVSDLVKVAGCSRRSLEIGFQQFLGCSPARYVLLQKLELAHQRLQQSQGTVSEVADQCGFNHLSHFTRLYKDHFGETPSQTLKQRTLVPRG